MTTKAKWRVATKAKRCMASSYTRTIKKWRIAAKENAFLKEKNNMSNCSTHSTTLLSEGFLFDTDRSFPGY